MMAASFSDDVTGREPDSREGQPDSQHTVWENQFRGGWDEFQRSRALFLLGLAVDSTLNSVLGEQPGA
jgi:hypothetical protein